MFILHFDLFSHDFSVDFSVGSLGRSGSWRTRSSEPSWKTPRCSTSNSPQTRKHVVVRNIHIYICIFNIYFIFNIQICHLSFQCFHSFLSCNLASEFFILPFASTGSMMRSRLSMVAWTSQRERRKDEVKKTSELLWSLLKKWSLHLKSFEVFWNFSKLKKSPRFCTQNDNFKRKLLRFASARRFRTNFKVLIAKSYSFDETQRNDTESDTVLTFLCLST